MPAKRETSIITYILLILLGGSLTFIAYSYFDTLTTEGKKYTNDYAKVQKIDGLYVFIESSPAVDTYTSIEITEGPGLIDVWNSLGVGKEGVGKVLENLLN